MSISDFLEKKVKKVVKDLKKLRKPVKIINRKKPCEYCDKYKFIVVYKRNSNKVLAYKCDHCGYSVFVGKKIVKKKEVKQPVENIEFKCPLGGIEHCVKGSCTYYGNKCKLI